MNTYIYHTVNGYIMIDTGYEHSMKNVEKRANKQGIAFSEIKYIFLTHAHDDHAGFLNELLSKYPELKVIISHLAMPTLLDSVYRRLSQDSAPDSDATNLHSSKKRCRVFRIAGSNSPPAF